MAQGITVEFIGADELRDAIRRLDTSSPKMKHDLNKIILAVLKKARRDMQGFAKSEMKATPGKAYLAVRTAVYKRIFGGNVNILNRKKNNGKQYVGGNHTASRPASARTKQLQGYYGTDRGFILRFLNAGTVSRVAKTMNAHTIRRTERTGKRVYKTGTIGARGKIEGSNWFAAHSTQVMNDAAGRLSGYIERAIYEVWDNRAIDAGVFD